MNDLDEYRQQLRQIMNERSCTMDEAANRILRKDLIRMAVQFMAVAGLTILGCLAWEATR